jgi:hypothetical protein
MEIRVTKYQNDNGSYYVAQMGYMSRGRWKTTSMGMRHEVLFCIEEHMTEDSPAGYKAACKITKQIAKEYAIQWREKLAAG